MGCGFDPWSQIIPHAMELLDPCTTATEAATTMRSLCTVMMGRAAKKVKKNKQKKTLRHWLEPRSWGEGRLEAPWGRELGLSDGGPGGMGGLSWRRVGRCGVRSQIYTPNTHSGCSAEKN